MLVLRERKKTLIHVGNSAGATKCPLRRDILSFRGDCCEKSECRLCEQRGDIFEKEVNSSWIFQSDVICSVTFVKVSDTYATQRIFVAKLWPLGENDIVHSPLDTTRSNGVKE